MRPIGPPSGCGSGRHPGIKGTYESIGVTGDLFAAWQGLYGIDGVGEYGSVPAPEFPVISRVAWMYIDPVALSPSETKALVGECEKAMPNVGDAAAREELLEKSFTMNAGVFMRWVRESDRAGDERGVVSVRGQHGGNVGVGSSYDIVGNVSSVPGFPYYAGRY